MSTHLSPQIKRAIKTQQQSTPHGFPKYQSTEETLSAIKTSISILEAKRSQVWHIILVTAYTGFNFGKGIKILWKYIDETVSDTEQKVRMAAEMRESIVKCVAFLGIPRVLMSIEALQKAQGPQITTESNRVLESQRTETFASADASMKAGQALWADVYAPAKLSSKLFDKITGFHPDLANLIVRDSYGHNMSSVSVINRENTSALAVAALRVEEDVQPQLTSHIFGLLKGGGDQEYVEAILVVVDGLRSGELSVNAKL